MTSDLINIDLDRREALIRERVFAELPAYAEPDADHVICTYFVMTVGSTLSKIAKNIAKNQTTGGDEDDPATLLGKSSAQPLRVISFDSDERVGLIKILFPSRIFLAADGVLYSNALLHIV